MPGTPAGYNDVYVHDRNTHLTGVVSLSSAGQRQNGYAGSQSISANGRFAIVETDADNMVPNDTNATTDEFVRDRWLNTTERVTVNSSGEGVPNSYSYFGEISPDGRYVTYTSAASNLVPNYTNEAEDIFIATTARRTSLSGSAWEVVGRRPRAIADLQRYHLKADLWRSIPAQSITGPQRRQRFGRRVCACPGG